MTSKFGTEDTWEAYDVIATGWTQPQTYHVIREDGVLGESTYLGMMTLDKLLSDFNITEVVPFPKNLGNDQFLGAKVRSEFTNWLKEINLQNTKKHNK